MNSSKYEHTPPRKEYYTIGEIAKLYHIGVDTLRYYEERGILTPIRGENGYRYYDSQSIWRMNVIFDLRSLGFSTERIRDYFQSRTIAAAQELLKEELSVVSKKIQDLRALQKAVKEQLHTIQEAASLEIGKIRILNLQPRKAFEIEENYNMDEDMDLLMMHLLEQSAHNHFLIGNNRMGAIISENPQDYIYRGAFVFDAGGTAELPGGTYLSVCYKGKTDSLKHVKALQAYASAHRITLEMPFIELVWIDIHTSSDITEFINEVQVRALL